MTKLWAEKRGLYIVAPAWVKACVEQKCRVPEACYSLKDKEDVGLADDCDRITSRNVPPVRREPVSDSHSGFSHVLRSATINSPLSCPKSPLTVEVDSWRKRTCETALSSLEPSHSSNGLFSKSYTAISPPGFTMTKPPPGWMRLPSPPQEVANLPLPLFPEDDTLTLETQPRPPDFIGPLTLSRMPLSPDMLHFVVRNFASSTTVMKKNQVSKSQKLVPLSPVRVTPSQEKKIICKTPTQKQRRRNRSPRSRPLLRRQLLGPHNGPPNASDICGSRKKALKNDQEGAWGQKTQQKRMKSVEVVAQPRRKSLRLLSRAANRLGSVMDPSGKGVATTSKSIAIDSATSLKSPKVNTFLYRFQSSQRQTLVALLRSSTGLSKHEVAPTLNNRLCGSGGVGDIPFDQRSPRALVLAAILGTEEESLKQRWRLADIFSTHTTTHLVSTSPFPRTINLFKAVLSSVPVVDTAWIVESAKVGKWLPFRHFLVSLLNMTQRYHYNSVPCVETLVLSSQQFLEPTGLLGIMQKIRGLPSARAASKLQKLFSTVGCVFVAAGTSPSPSDLKDLIIMGGGSVSKRAVGAKLIVGQKDANKPSVSPKWVLAFPWGPLDADVISSLNPFADTIHVLASLAKNCVLRIRKDSMSFIIREHSTQGGAEIWCELDQTNVFSECICEGISPEQDEIFLEIIPEEIMHCLRGVSNSAFSSGAGSVLTSQSHTTVGSSGVTLPRGQTTLHNFVSTARGLKIKLVRRKTPCLALEVEQASISGRSRAVWHFVPVHILPLRLWSDFEETPDPDFDLSIFLPPVKNLRLFVDRMKHFARFLTIRATGGGDLYLEINMETLARVRLTFKGLRARDWHLPEGAEPNPKESASTSPTSFFATIDIRRFSQLLSAQRVQPSWFVCSEFLYHLHSFITKLVPGRVCNKMVFLTDIVQDRLIQFVMLFEHSRLKYTLPTSYI
ncbi:unnamed protein product [Hydatigera taeniaeformis]|uniref:BRCT domain-containing protein n=1 Tax=Hydatigena taeniaeformis TaxID=6205 RepID=A0A0R3WNH0_HYDTA|nr:unnamed protein product [Hydatigera taeniaeformis]